MGSSFNILKNMKEIKEPAVVEETRRESSLKYAVSRSRELEKDAYEFLELYGIMYNVKTFDENEEFASNVFAGAINFASNVFCNRLVLGAGDYRKEDKIKIITALREILGVLEK